jgi:hypothetical protein
MEVMYIGRKLKKMREGEGERERKTERKREREEKRSLRAIISISAFVVIPIPLIYLTDLLLNVHGLGIVWHLLQLDQPSACAFAGLSYPGMLFTGAILFLRVSSSGSAPSTWATAHRGFEVAARDSAFARLLLPARI